jgi:hypothetical protein
MGQLVIHPTGLPAYVYFVHVPLLLDIIIISEYILKPAGWSFLGTWKTSRVVVLRFLVPDANWIRIRAKKIQKKNEISSFEALCSVFVFLSRGLEVSPG